MIITIFVNGYGARDVRDQGYISYLGKIVADMCTRRKDEFILYLCGGYTNRTDRTEAQSLEETLRLVAAEYRKFFPKDVSIRRIENATTARDNVVAFYEKVGDIPVVVYCEYSRRRTMRFFVRKFFKSGRVIGIKFDARSLTFGHRLSQLFFHYPLEVLAWHFSIFERARLALRRRRIERARKERLPP